MGKKKVVEQRADELVKGKPETGAAPAKAPASGKGRKIADGRIYIAASYNNTVVTVTDKQGDVLAWATAGSLGFSGPKKATPFAASKIIAVIAEKLKNVGLMNVDVFVRGIGGGRDSAVRSLVNHGFNITSLRDVTPIPHNGPRPRKVRRV